MGLRPIRGGCGVRATWEPKVRRWDSIRSSIRCLSGVTRRGTVVILAASVIWLASGASEETTESVTLRDVPAEQVVRIELVPSYKSVEDPRPTFATEVLETHFGDVKIAVGDVPIAVVMGKKPYPSAPQKYHATGPFGLAGFFASGERPGRTRSTGSGQASRYSSKGTLEPWQEAKAGLLREAGFGIVKVPAELAGGFSWGEVDGARSGRDFSFSRQDTLTVSLQMHDINLYPILSPWKKPGQESNYVPGALAAYASFVQASVRRYDRDKSFDFELLRYPVLYYQLEENPFLTNRMRFRENFMNGEEYAQVLKTTYGAVKKARRSAMLVLGSVDVSKESAIEEGTRKYLQTLGSQAIANYFDAFAVNLEIDDFDSRKLEGILKEIQSLLKAEKPFVVTNLTIQGVAPSGRVGPQLTAEDNRQASLLVRVYLWLLVHKCHKIFWSTLQDSEALGSETQAHAGLITEQGDRKLAFYAHWNLTQILAGCDFFNVETISGGERGIYVYRLERLDLNQPVFLIWREKPPLSPRETD